MILFSATNTAFYDDKLEDSYKASSNWPDDLVELTTEDHAIYSGQPPEGKELGSMGGSPAWVDAPTINYVPQVVTMRQARLALLSQGLLSSVESAIDTLEDPPKSEVRIEWEYSQTVERDRPFVTLLGNALGLDEAGLDDLFTLAATL